MKKTTIKLSLALKLSIYILTSLTFVFISVLIYNYRLSRDYIVKNIHETTQHILLSSLNEIDIHLSVVQRIAEDIAFSIECSNLNEDEMFDLLKIELKNCDEIQGCAVAFEPYMFDKNKYFFDPYFYKKEGIITFYESNDSLKKEYDYFHKNWYSSPKKSNKGTWSEPFFRSSERGISMIIYSCPFYKKNNGQREFCGVVAIDVDLKWLNKIIDGTDIFDEGFAFLLSSRGAFFMPNKETPIWEENIFSMADNLKDNTIRDIGNKMVGGQTGHEKYYSYFYKKTSFLFFAPLKKTGWSMGLVVPEDELFFDLNEITLRLFAIGMTGYLLTLVLIVFLAKRITSPLSALTKAMYEIGEGHLNTFIPIIKSYNEIGVLSESFRSMQQNLIFYIKNLEETTASKERIERELSIAREIQQDLLPHNFPSIKQLDVYAMLSAAKEIGGDLYDFFFIDKKHFCFAIGDVSGKGIPAALFMAIVKTLLRSKINLCMNPADVLTSMNEDLFRSNESSMFVTFFLGVLNLETGELEYSNAGHNPPLIDTEGKGFSFLYAKPVLPPLGVKGGLKYVGQKLKLCESNVFFLYTDGVTEALDINNVEFSEERLKGILNGYKNENVVGLVNKVKSMVDEHASNALQSDDIAIFVFKYLGPFNTTTSKSLLKNSKLILCKRFDTHK